MQKVFTVDKIRLADQYTIENEPINSIDLMERASLPQRTPRKYAKAAKTLH